MSDSKLQLKINELRKKCATYENSSAKRKHQITQFNNLIRKLIKEKRITPEEVGEFVKSKHEYIRT